MYFIFHPGVLWKGSKKSVGKICIYIVLHRTYEIIQPNIVLIYIYNTIYVIYTENILLYTPNAYTVVYIT